MVALRMEWQSYAEIAVIVGAPSARAVESGSRATESGCATAAKETRDERDLPARPGPSPRRGVGER